MKPDTSMTKAGWNSLHWVLRYGVHKVSGMHRLSRGHTQLWHCFSKVSDA